MEGSASSMAGEAEAYWGTCSIGVSSSSGAQDGGREVFWFLLLLFLQGIYSDMYSGLQARIITTLFV